MSKAADPGALAAELARRRKDVDDDDEIAGHVADAIRDVLRRKQFDPEKDTVLIPSYVLVEEVVRKFAGEKMNPVSGMRWLYLLGIRELRKGDANMPYRGALWHPHAGDDFGAMLKWADRFGTGGLPD
jgi:hypothetical protein